MWPFYKNPSKEWLQNIKTVRINGHRFRIKSVNPLADFSTDKMPQIFASSYATARAFKEGDKVPVEYAKRVRSDMMALVEAGLVEPELVSVGIGDKKGKEQGITIEDIARDEATFTKLYWEIWLHSLNKFRGIRNFFFSLRLRYSLWTASRAVTGESRQMSAGLTEGLA